MKVSHEDMKEAFDSYMDKVEFLFFSEVDDWPERMKFLRGEFQKKHQETIQFERALKERNIPFPTLNE